MGPMGPNGPMGPLGPKGPLGPISISIRWIAPTGGEEGCGHSNNEGIDPAPDPKQSTGT